MRRVVTALMAFGLLAVGGVGYYAGTQHALSPSQLAAADDCQSFQQTGFQVCGDFLNYWKANGGLAQQGYPISPTFQEKSETDGKTYTVQYFERAVFEAHPENQPPFNVLLSLLGSQKYKTKYPNGAPATVAPPTAAPTKGPTTTPSTQSGPHATLAPGGTITLQNGPNGRTWIVQSVVTDPTTDPDCYSNGNYPL